MSDWDMDAIKWPRHLGGLHMEHNDHKSSYQTIEQYENPGYGRDLTGCWVSPEQRQKAIDTDSLWLVQWYPETPIGFHVVAGADLSACLRRAVEISPP